MTTPVETSVLTPKAKLSALSRVLVFFSLLIALLALAGAGYAWWFAQELRHDVATQVAKVDASAKEGNTVARLAGEQNQEMSSRVHVLQGKVAELEAQRSQIDAMLSKIAWAKDENLLVDVDSAIQLGQQQSQLTGSVQPLLAALLSAEKRLKTSSLSHLVPVQMAVERDIEAIRKAEVSDVPALAQRMDSVLNTIGTLPLQSDKIQAPRAMPAAAPIAPTGAWWERLWQDAVNTVHGLVRVREINGRDAVLLAPDQAVYVREHLRLRLLNARMALLARYATLARNDVKESKALVEGYFQKDTPLVQNTLQTLEELESNIHSTELPAITETLDALAKAHTVAAAQAKAARPILVAPSAPAGAASVPVDAASKE